MFHRYFIEMQFNGTRYKGWQVQPESPTIQAELNEKLGLILGESVHTTGAGRTDTGVHATHFMAHFDSHTDIGPKKDNIMRKLNGFLSPDIYVQRIIPVHQDAHARYDAISRTYSYYITTHRDVFRQEFAWQLWYELDIDRMNEGAGIIQKAEDFTSFSKLHSDVKTHICHIKTAGWSKKNGRFVFTITADRFLRNMVRAIVGTLVLVGRNKLTVNELKDIIKSRNRSEAGDSAPSKGLFLSKIEYPYAL